MTAKEIQDMIKDCLFTEEEVKNNPPKEGEFVAVDGIVSKLGFHPERLKSKIPRLKEIIQELNPTFFEGWSFLNLPFDKDGNQWGEQRDAESLLMMCIGNGLAKFLLSRDMWDALPGGMPYIIFNKD